LSGDALRSTSSGSGAIWIYLVMILGALAFALATQRLEAIPALILFIFTVGGLGFIDIKFLFERNYTNWNTSFLYLELGTIFFLTLAMKYVLEEKDKRFLKSAFGKYVAPALVDSIV